MKIIALNRELSADKPTEPVAADIIPDSAMVIQGRPVFVPDISSGWTARCVAAVRICRLGRDIAPRFARRYVDAVTMAVRLVSTDNDPLTSAVDSTFAPGQWTEIPDEAAQITVNGVNLPAVNLNDAITDAVAYVSRYMTLKMGDIITLGWAGASSDAKPGVKITAAINGLTTTEVRLV